MLTERQKKELFERGLEIFIILGGVVTLSYAIYFLVDYFKKWS
jgi:hypothetical protein